jgi:hypothetical protein
MSTGTGAKKLKKTKPTGSEDQKFIFLKTNGIKYNEEY